MLAEVDELHARGGKTEGGVAIAAHDARRERAVVDSDADGSAFVFAEREKGVEFLADATKFVVPLFVGVVALFASDEIARIDADFFD